MARLNIPATLKQLPQLTQTVERDNLFKSDPGKIAFASGQNPIKHVIYVLKENRTYDQILGDLKVGEWRSVAHHVWRRHHAQRAQTRTAVRGARQLLRQRGSLRRRASLVHGRDHADYNEKTWQIAYRGKERTYDFQGQNADEYPARA